MGYLLLKLFKNSELTQGFTFPKAKRGRSIIESASFLQIAYYFSEGKQLFEIHLYIIKGKTV